MTSHCVIGHRCCHRWYHIWHDTEDDDLPARRAEERHRAGGEAKGNLGGRGHPPRRRRCPRAASATGRTVLRGAVRRAGRRAAPRIREPVIVADTSGLLAYFNAAEPKHAVAVDAVAAEPDPLVVSPFVVAELDYLVATRVGV